MILSIFAIVGGLALLVWSADRFVEGSASTARYFGMPALLIGVIIIGFGTSAPEMIVSAIAASQGNPEIALGNAYGSNITNIALILGFTAILSPVTVQSGVLRKELPVLTAATGLAAWQIRDNSISTVDALILLAGFFCLLSWSVIQGIKERKDTLAGEVRQRMEERTMPIRRAVFWMSAGLVVLLLSSRILVWGAVDLARALGVGDLVIGLTIVAIGTSLPELASSIIAARKGEHDIAMGNVIGSNLFNTLAVVGIAGVIQPMSVGPEVLSRDILVMGALTLSIFIVGYGFKGESNINRLEGSALLSSYAVYIGHLLWTV